MELFTPELESVIKDTIKEVYQTLAEYYQIPENEVPSWGICRKLTLPLMAILGDYLKPSEFHRDVRQSWSGDTHHYVVIGDVDEGVVIEGAWQQFVPKTLQNSSLPPFIIGPRENVIETVASAGVWKCDQELWTSKSEYTDPTEAMDRHPSNRLNRVA